MQELTHKEIREKITTFSRRSLAQHIRHLTKKWIKEKITVSQMNRTEEYWYGQIADMIKTGKSKKMDWNILKGD